MSFFESRIVSSASKSRGLIGNPAYSPDLSELVELGQSPLSNSKRTVKRILDVVGAGLALLLLSPLMLLTALAIRMESGGPILFRQQRVGYNAKRFVIFKFRTMVVMEDDDSIAQVRRFDPRVTKLGRVLRANSVDELPQLMNVLSGEMSLVGPRPHAVAHDIYYSKTLSDYSLRHRVKPGMTGWAQIHGWRGETSRLEDMKRRLEFDLRYIENQHLWMDVKILLRTCVEVMRGQNAY